MCACTFPRTGLHNGDEKTRHRLAVYCIKDAVLPKRLLDRLMMLFNYTEMARVTGVPIAWLLERGQSIKVMSQILRAARKRNMVAPHIPKTGGPTGQVSTNRLCSPFQPWA